MFTRSTTLIIPTKDRYFFLEKQLLFIKKSKLFFKEIIVVDSSTKTKKKNKILCKKFDTKFISTYPSTSHQRNIGLRNIKKTKYVMFLDDDIIFFKDSFKEMNYAINKYKNVTGFCFNIVEKNNNNIFDNLKKIKLFSLLKIYSIKKGIVMPNGWHTQLYNLKRNKKVQWIYSGATVFKYQDIIGKYFLEDVNPYCYLEDLDYSYSLFKKKKILMCIAKAKILNSNISIRNTFDFGIIEIVNRYNFVKKSNLNISLFYISAFIKMVINFLITFKFGFGMIKRAVGNFKGITSCVIKN